MMTQYCALFHPRATHMIKHDIGSAEVNDQSFGALARNRARPRPRWLVLKELAAKPRYWFKSQCGDRRDCREHLAGSNDADGELTRKPA
jgi:hypothetical protein